MARSIRRYAVAGALALFMTLAGTVGSASAQVQPPIPPLPQVPQLAPGGHITSPVCGDIAVVAALLGVAAAGLPLDTVAQVVNSGCQLFPPPEQPMTCTITDPIDTETEEIPANVDVVGWVAGAFASALAPTGAGEALVEPLGCAPIAAPTAPPALPEAPPEAAPPSDGLAPLAEVPFGTTIIPDDSGFVAGSPTTPTAGGVATPGAGAAAAPASTQRGPLVSALPVATARKEEWTAGRYFGLVLVPLLVIGGFAASAWARGTPEELARS